jgi:2-haloacid dehalogenase
MPLENKKVLTFDCYGTLIDWEQGIVDAMQPILLANDVHLSDEEILIDFGQTEHVVQAAAPDMLYSHVLQQVMYHFGKKYGFNPTHTEAESFSSSIKYWKPFPDTVLALKKLSKEFKLIIVSNIDNVSISATVEQLDVEFYRTFTAQEIGAYKPDEKVFSYVFEKLSREGIQKDDILHVAESLFHDHVPAGNLHLDSVWINRRYDKMNPGATPAVDASYIPDLQFNNLHDFAVWVERQKTC